MSPESANREHDGITINDLRYDEKYFEAFFAQNFVSLCSYCQYRFSFDLDLSKEIVHTAFLRLWEAKENLDNDVAALPYLQKIIVNKALDMLKHEKVKARYARHMLAGEHDAGESESFDSIDFKQLSHEVNAAIASMPDQMRRIFELSRYDQLKYSEIALQLNISSKTVETQISRALAKLRQKLAGYLTTFSIGLLFIYHVIKNFTGRM